MVRTPKHAALLALAALTLGGGLSACGGDDTAKGPTSPPAPPIDVAKSVSEAPTTAKVRLVVDILADNNPDRPGLSVRTRADFTIATAISKTAAENDAATFKGIDLLQQDDAKLTDGLVPFGPKTKWVEQSATAATIVSEAKFLADIKGGPLPVLISWSGSAATAASTKALLRRTPIEVRTIPLKAAS